MHTAWLYDEVDPVYGCGAAEFTASLPPPGQDVEVRVNCVGGLAFDGLAIYSTLAQRRGLVRVVVDGLAASIATVICMAASPGELISAPGSTWMIHQAHTLIAGDAGDLRKAADVLDVMSGTIARVYEARTGVHDHMWLDLMAAETWFTAEEAVTAGLADKILARVAA